MKKSVKGAGLIACLSLMVGCSQQILNGDSKVAVINSGVEPENVTEWESELDADFEVLLNALTTSSETEALLAFDQKYGTNMADDSSLPLASRASSGKSSSDYEPMKDMPFNVDGAIYLSGGTSDVVGTVIDWVSPKNFPGNYYHGAVLDLDKYDPNDEEVYCLETAVTKGAGYETAGNWRTKVNARVMNPNFAVNKTKLDAAQKALDKYCDMDNKDVKYGFFKNNVDIFNPVTKSDTKTWYCTKVVWAVYDKYGIDIDTNSNAIDYTTSGLYSIVKNYYGVKYFYSSSKKNKAINDYINNAKNTLVLAEEIYLSPYFTKVFERIREN